MKNRKVKIIAEVGLNHNGSLKLAKKIVKKLSRLDIDFIKFQFANPNLLYSDDSFKAEYQKKNDKEKSIKSMSKKLQLKPKEHIDLAKYCIRNGKKYACTAFDTESLKFLLKEINLPFIKIPSGEIISIDLLKLISKQKKPIVLSTGMATIKEIEDCLKLIKKNSKNKVTIMHCVSSYPAKVQHLNINVIDTLRKKFNLPIGYSDHSLTDEACLAAIAKGASIIEKHVTLNKNFHGPDHKMSYTVEELKVLVNKVRNLEKILGVGKKIFSENEIKIRKMARKSIIAKNNIKKGCKIYRKDICFKRPGTGISPMKVKHVLGKKTRVNIVKNKIIKKAYII